MTDGRTDELDNNNAILGLVIQYLHVLLRARLLYPFSKNPTTTPDQPWTTVALTLKEN